jgi:hypothetical protein
VLKPVPAVRLPALLRPLALGLLLVAAAPVARAECARAYTKGELLQDLGTMTSALRSLDEAAFRQSGARMEQSLPCIRTRLPPQVHASAYRFIGAYHFLNGKADEAGRWFRVALELQPTFEWDVNELSLDHPMRAAFELERTDAAVDPAPIEGMEVVTPAGSVLLLDGRELTKAAATTGRPHVLQVLGTDGTVRQVFVIDGNQIPAAFLQPAAAAAPLAAADPKKGKKGAVVAPASPADDYAVVKVARIRPPAKTPLMITGGAVALGAGALYGASFATRARFDAATTSAEMDRYRGLTNTLVVASGATLAIGLGVEYAGIILDGRPGLQLRARF